ncbi:MAG: hypothetical protein Q8928_16695 [Bacteroidota bacterium]|nr:hypothetical protein [Bacteroidota bacterium]
MSNPKSLRFDRILTSKIEKNAQNKSVTFSKSVVEILEDYFTFTQEVTYELDGINYYPIHLTNEELIMIMDEFLSQISDGSNCQVKVRKDSGGKGIDFQVNFYSEYKSKNIKKIRYTFSINANWKLANVNKHWISETSEIQKELFKGMPELKIHTINNLLQDSLKSNYSPEVNSNFKEDSWKTLFEKKYPILKLI